ncbi:MAG: GNAT family N-acetyltransferase [Propionibacteriales bacterium]|nr:GNAT family N-acetyltransferase [Propionibacteriales bacterium]
MTTVERLEPIDDSQFAEFHEVYRAAHDDEWDIPHGEQEQRVKFLEAGTYVETVGLIARDDSGNSVGIGIAEIPLKDNLNFAYLELRVVPDHRRLGHGAALLVALLGVSRQSSRTTVMAEARWNVGETDSGNTLFARSQGFHLDLVDAHRVLDLPATMPEAPVCDGYALRSWRGPCPEEWIDQYAVLLSLIAQDAPSGDLKLEKEFFDAGRVRFQEESLARQGRIRQISVALAPDGSLAGHTQLVFPEADPSDVYQWDTLVLSKHRGHGLGLSLKVHAMEASRDLLAGRSVVHTYNAASNGPMIAVNEALGFRLASNVGEFVRML